MSRNNRTFILVMFMAMFMVGSTAFAQYGGGGGMGGGGMGGGMGGGGNRGGGGGNNSNGNNSNGGGGGGSGVIIEADGILRMATFDSKSLDKARLEASYKAISEDLRTPNKMRKVSLNRLEAAIIANKGTVTEEMQNLAGLQKIDYVFFYPESGDIVLAGPAEGWTIGQDGAVVGFKSKLPTLKLSDLVTALRAYPAEGKSTDLIGCSIDPTEEGLRNLQTLLSNVKNLNVTDNRAVDLHAKEIKGALGIQNVKIWGISPKTDFAKTLVAADYRMKLIGIGLVPAPVRMTTYADKSNPTNISRNALVRWYFQPDYKCVVMSEDHNAMHLVGDGVFLRGEDELVTSAGQRVTQGGKGNVATRAYARNFTDRYSQIAKNVPVYAALRNLIDMSIVAVYLQKENLYKKANWKMEFFANEEKYPLETEQSVLHADTAVNVLRHGTTTVSFPVGGGVQIHPSLALDSENMTYEKNSEVTKNRPAAESLKNLPKGSWWWN